MAVINYKAVRRSLKSLRSQVGSAMVGFIQAGTGAIFRNLQDKGRERVTPMDFGAVGDGVTDDTAAIQAMFAAGAKVYDFLNKRYLVSVAEGSSLVTLTSQSNITIKGDRAVIYDPRVYANTSALTIMFNLDACTGVTIKGLNYEGVALASPSDATDGIGYLGATWVNLKNGCEDIDVEGELTDLRYGVRSGDYTDETQGYNKKVRTKLKTLRCGYPIVHYLAEDVDADLYAESSHRAAYLAGVKGFKVDARVKDQYIAPIQVYMTCSKTGTGTSRGCSSGRVRVQDMGSTVFTANSWLAGISPQRVDPGTEHQDIEVECYLKATDTIATTLGAFCIYSQANTYQPSYTFNWEPTIYLRNIRVSGTLDRSAQTASEHGTGEIYVYTIDSGVHYATVQGLDVSNFQYIPGSGSKPRGFWFINPGLIGPSKFDNCYFGTETPFYYGTNSTSSGLFNNCTLRGSYSSTTDSPYNSAASFVYCTIADSAYQPMTNKSFTNTLVQGSGGTSGMLMTELTLTGASVNWANSLPGNSIIEAVSGRVTQEITGATGYQVGDGTTAGRFADTNTLTLGSTFTLGNGSDTTPKNQASTGSITVTAKTSNFTAGKLRLSVVYRKFTPPSS